MKVVLNKCAGAFELSAAAITRVRQLLGDVVNLERLTEKDRRQRPFAIGSGADVIRRNDPAVVRTVEELKALANGRQAELAIVNIPDNSDWYIIDVVGIEYIYVDGEIFPEPGNGEAKAMEDH